jgi:hypothetical protein
MNPMNPIHTIVGIAFLVTCIVGAAVWSMAQLFRGARTYSPGPEPAPDAQPVPVEPCARNQWTDLIDRDPVDRAVINAVDVIHNKVPAWTGDPTAYYDEFLTIADDMPEVQELLTQIVDAELYLPAKEEKTSQ